MKNSLVKTHISLFDGSQMNHPAVKGWIVNNIPQCGNVNEATPDPVNSQMVVTFDYMGTLHTVRPNETIGVFADSDKFFIVPTKYFESLYTDYTTPSISVMLNTISDKLTQIFNSTNEGTVKADSTYLKRKVRELYLLVLDTKVDKDSFKPFEDTNVNA